jgi:serine/threonine-protein kinase
MYCPKCKQSFEEGSRRFCPTDGARLVSEASSESNESQAGIFANLIPKMGGISDLGSKLAEAPGVFVAGSESVDNRVPGFESDDDDVFFEIDDVVESEADTKLLFEPSQRSEATLEPIPADSEQSNAQVVKKVDPTTIPEGGVDLDGGHKGSDLSATLDIENPENLVGNLVKGRYRVTEFLGSEETGLAYLAEDQISNGKTVLVRVHAHGEVDEMMESMLAEERISLSHFSHPNIARFVDSGEFVNGISFIVSEYVDGLTVGDILAIHGSFDPKRSSRILRQISGALNEAHQEGILHRDIRPENIVIDPDSGDVEQAKLVNFGASGGAANSDNLVYKSPEVVDGRINTIVSDIFSLGVVAYEMLTGALPFEGKSKNEILRSQYSGLAAVPSVLRTELPTAVNEVLSKGLSFKPADRYKKAREFGDALTGALMEVPGEHKVERPNIVNLQPLAPDLEAKTELQKPTPRIQIPPVKRTDAVQSHSEDPKESDAGVPVHKRDHNVWYVVGAIAVLLALGTLAGWYYYLNRSAVIQSADGSKGDLAESNISNTAPANEADQIPLASDRAQPPNSDLYKNTKEDLKGDLAENFLRFSLFYPKGWKVIGPQPGTAANARGKFLDISRSTVDGRLQEQMLISYYSSGGTFEADAGRFPQLVRETNNTLEKILPGYQMVSEGEITFNGGLRAYEVKFQGGGKSSTGGKLLVWGRRLFVPASHPGVPNGFEITMLATSDSENVRGVDEVGVRGELGPVLSGFEPAQNF